MSFSQDVYSLVKLIPEGRVSTYSEIARALGKPGAWRAVGNALSKNNKLKEIPCYRIVKSSGEIGGYVKGKKEKKRLLQKEGIVVEGNKIDLKKFFFRFNK